MNILDELDALPDSLIWVDTAGLVQAADLKQLAADHRKLRERLADAETCIDHYADKKSWNEEDENFYRRDGKGYLAAQAYRKKYPEVIE